MSTRLGEWNVFIQKDFNRGMEYNNLIYFMRDKQGKNGVVTEFLTENGSFVEAKEGISPKEPAHFAAMSDEQLQVLANALSSRGLKTESAHRFEGILEAQTKHLEDMRILVFKKDVENGLPKS